MTELLAKFLKYLEFEKRFSALTIVSYNTDISQFFSFLEEFHPDIDIKEISPIVVRSWMVNLINENGKSSTINRKISSIRSFFKFLQKNDIVDSNPTSNMIRPKMPKRVPKDIRSDKLIELKEYLEESDLKGSFSSYRDYTIFCILYGTGMRRAELVDLSWSDIDMTNKMITVIGKGKKERKIPINDSLFDILKEYKTMMATEGIIPEDNKVVVLDNGNKSYPNFIYRNIKKFLNTISLSEGVGPHTLRHSFATHILNEGGELNAIKDLLGHSSLASTQVYTSNSIEKLKKIHNSFHPKS